MTEEALNFNECLLETVKQRELIREYDRLSGTNIMQIFYDNRPPMVKMIDEATGYQKEIDKKAHEQMQGFIGFVFECIWIPYVRSFD